MAQTMMKENMNQPQRGAQRLSHITDVMSEVQEWAIKDNQAYTMNEDTMTSETRRALRNAGSICGLWETFYLCAGAPVLFVVTKNILIPFRTTPTPDWTNLWWMVVWVLFNYPLMNFLFSLLCLLKVKGPMSRKVLEIFLVTRAIFIVAVSFLVCVLYFWIIPLVINQTYNTSASFSFYVINTFGDLLEVFHYVFTESIKYISLFSLMTALIPLFLLFMQRAFRANRRSLADEFSISRENITL